MKAEIYYSNKDAHREGFKYLEDKGIWLYATITVDTIDKTDFSRYWTKVSEEELPTINSIVLEQIYHKYNTSINPLGTPEGQAKIRSRNVGHTSMSIGDIVKVGSKVFIVDDIGFKRMILR